MTIRRPAALLLLLAAAVAAGCATTPPSIPQPAPAADAPAAGLSPAEQYAGEVLAYLLQVVLGHAGPADLRAEWAGRGLDVPLDFSRIAGAMREFGQNRSDLVVLDTRILGISEVLYHYDPRLNLFKAEDGRLSLFPSVELIALRLLLLQKMARGETLCLNALAVRKAKLLDSRLPVTDQDLSETGLSRTEMGLLRDALGSDPHLYGYLVYPPIVRTLYRIGAARYDPLVAAAENASAATGAPCRFSSNPRTGRSLRIALVPSFSRAFAPAGGDRRTAVLEPSAFYRRMSETLKRRILAQVNPDAPPSDAVTFSAAPRRPSVIYPENAAVEIRRLCPEADFAVVLLGKDVIRSFSLSPQEAPLPDANMVYIDIMDIERSYTGPELEAVGRFIASRLE